MSTITETQPIAAPRTTEWIPAPESLYRMSIEKYEAMVRSGVFTKRDRFHLISGLLVAKPMTQNTPHSTADELCGKTLDRVFSSGCHVRGGKPIRIPSQMSMPEPDRSVARGAVRDYLARDPDPADVLLVVEVADSSLRDNRALAQVYGAGGIPCYWIVNLVDRQVEVHSGPCSAGYQAHQNFKPGQDIPVVADGVEIGRIAVDDLLP
jgi:Uma2 family endonuclease